MNLICRLGYHLWRNTTWAGWRMRHCSRCPTRQRWSSIYHQWVDESWYQHTPSLAEREIAQRRARRFIRSIRTIDGRRPGVRR